MTAPNPTPMPPVEDLLDALAAAPIDVEALLQPTDKRCTVELIRDLDSADLADYAMSEDAHEQRGHVMEPVDLAKIRSRHHLMARLIAQGIYTDVQVAAMCNISTNRLSVLRGAPAFAELVAHYNNLQATIVPDVPQHLQDTALAALEEINERLEDPKLARQIPVATLVQVSKLGFDRSNNGPSSTKRIDQRVTLVDAGELREMKRQALAREAELVSRPAVRALPAPEEARDGDER